MKAISALLLPLLFQAPAADGWLGVYLDPDREEAVVSEPIPGSPAEKAGLKMGDVLLAVDEKKTPTREDFVAAIRTHNAGDRVRITFRRGEKDDTVVVKLAERTEEGVPAPTAKTPDTQKPGAKDADKKPPAPSRPAVEVAPMEPRGAGASKPFLGLSVRTTDDGVVIDKIVPRGPAEGSALAPGDRLTTLDNRPIGSLADIDKILGKLQPGRKVAIGVEGPDGVRSVMLTLGERHEAADTAPVLVPRATARARNVEPKAAPKPEPRPEPKPATRSAGERDLDAEIDALRREVQELRKQLEELQRKKGRE
jgi:S1-C subfamily serine protease